MKSMHEYVVGTWRQLLDERGQVLVFLATGLAALLGMTALVLDGAVLYENRRQLQNAADGAALAGARYLVIGDQAMARYTAYEYARKNGVSDSSEVQSVEFGTDAQYGYPIITVRVQREVGLFFARALGRSSSRVGAVATAIVAPTKPEDLWPWGTTWYIIDHVPADQNGTVVMKVGAQNSIYGNFMAVEFEAGGGGGGAKTYENNIKYGYNGYVGLIPWTIESKTGNMVGPTRDGVNYLMALTESEQYAYCNPLNPQWIGIPDTSCPNFGVVPIIGDPNNPEADWDWANIRGKGELSVIGFAVFQLLGYGGEEQGSGQAQVTGNFNYETIMSSGSRGWDLGRELKGTVGVRLWPTASRLP